MEVSAGVNERLAALTEAGPAVGLDQIRRSLIEEGELQRLIDEYSLRGVTSNPSIFEKAILGSPDYDDDLREMAEEGLGPREIYERIAVQDVQMGADVLRQVHDRLDGLDGFVSLEVMPELAHNTEATLAQAREYWQRVDRPNVMIKIPGTAEGVPAIEEAIYEGINVNVPLLFSVEAYVQVAEAYIRGLERRHEEGKSVDIRSVASFFVSRVDTEVDKRLAELGERGKGLQGKAAILNARAAYARYKEVFRGARFAALRDAGAAVQRPLWASTGVKNPLYPETLYVDNLVAPETVNTMPMPTLLAAATKAEITGPTADVPKEEVERGLAELSDAGIDLDAVTEKLLRDGVGLFVQAMDKLLDGVERRREAVITGPPARIQGTIPGDLERGIGALAQKAAEEEVSRRIWAKDESLWGGPGVPEIGNRLGWLTIADEMLDEADDLKQFAAQCQADGLTDCVLLGMGGSSLAPEVFRRSFGNAGGGLRVQVLDSTDPGAVLEVERNIPMESTLFVVSSKSGGTIETLSHFRYFFEKAGRNGRQFIAITDPGSKLQEIGEQNGFRRVFLNDPDIGGRYSALSYFGIVPAALMGVDIRALLERAQGAEQACQAHDSSTNNSGLWLGLTLGYLATRGRDKATFVVGEPVSSFGLWVEQLIAESTGKEGKGILPVADEPLGDPDDYGADRVFMHLQRKESPEPGFIMPLTELAKAGQPTITVDVEGAEDLGRIMFFSELPTPVAGWVLGINPFDQPNVQEAKDNTNTVLDLYK